MGFDDGDAIATLDEKAKDGGLDDLPFGVIGIDDDDVVTDYNAFESEAAGLSRDRVIGRDFFTEIAPCMNNFMVSGRFDEADALDETIDYVLTLRMKPTRVRLRLLAPAAGGRKYVLVQR